MSSDSLSTLDFWTSRVGIVTGNPGVFQGNPHPYPRKTAPAVTGRGFRGYGLRVGLRTVPYTNGYTVPCDGYGTRTVRSLSLALDGTVYGTDLRV